MTTEQKLREALQQALTALENVITQVKYDEECAAAIIAARQTLATTETAVNQQLTTEPVDEREAFTNVTKDAERYRWLRDDTDSDWAICEWSHDPGDEGYYRDARAPHIVDAAIDAAMAQGVKG